MNNFNLYRLLIIAITAIMFPFISYAATINFTNLQSLSDKREFSNMSEEEIHLFRESKEYDLTYDYSEDEINGYSYEEFCEYFHPRSGIPATSLLGKFETKMVSNLNKGIKEYKLNINEPKETNNFVIIVKFETITKDAKSVGYIIALSKHTGNLSYRKFSTKAGRWNDFEVLLIEDAESPYVNAPDKYSIQTVSQAIENATYFFRKKGHKLIKEK